MSIVRVFQAFVREREQGSANDYYGDRSRGEFLGSLSLAICTLIVGDCVMVAIAALVLLPIFALKFGQIYRLRTVFNYNRSTTVFPVCCLFGFIGER